MHALRGPRDAALLACRRARPARRRREVLAQLRRRSRVGFARAGSPLERGGGGGTEVLVECRLECRPRGAIEARRQPAAGALSRFPESALAGVEPPFWIAQKKWLWNHPFAQTGKDKYSPTLFTN